MDDKDLTRFLKEPEVTAYKTAAAKRLPQTPAATDLLGDVYVDSLVAFRRIKGTPLQAFEVHNGSADCINFQFFANRNGTVQAVANPPQYAAFFVTDEQPQCFMMGERGLLGTVAGVPAFLTEGRGLSDYNYTASIAAWDGRRWGRPCAIEAFYRPIFSVGEIHCSPRLCASLKTLAPQIAKAVQEDEHSGRQEAFVWSKARGLASPAMRKLHDQVWAIDRDAIPEPHQRIAQDVVNSRDIFAVRIAGQDYMALMAHPGRGDYAEPGFSLVLFQSQGGEAKAVASVSIESRRGPLVSNRYGRWRSPYGALNPHHSALY